MLNLEELFDDYVQDYQTDSILINEVDSSVITLVQPGIADGCSYVEFDGNNKDYKATILVNEELSPEIKLNVLFHEYGHIRHFLTIGNEEYKRLRQGNDTKLAINDEYEAFRFQLLQIKKIARNDDKVLLRNLIGRLIERHKSNSEVYQRALEKLFSDPLWIDCLSGLI